jgi:hypothetical protein
MHQRDLEWLAEGGARSIPEAAPVMATNFLAK